MASIKEKLKVIPKELKTLIESSEFDEVIDEIMDEFFLPDTWRIELVRPVVAVLVGDLSPKLFIATLTDNLNLKPDEALMLARQINERIFKDVKPYLAELYSIEDEKIARRLRIPRKPREIVVGSNIDLTEVKVEEPVIEVGERGNEGGAVEARQLIPPVQIIESSQSVQNVLDMQTSAEIASPDVYVTAPANRTVSMPLDSAPIEIIPPPVQPTFAPEEPAVRIGAVPSPLTVHFAAQTAQANPQTQPEAAVTKPLEAPLQKPADLPQSALAQKLGGMRGDAYREAI